MDDTKENGKIVNRKERGEKGDVVADNMNETDTEIDITEAEGDINRTTLIGETIGEYKLLDEQRRQWQFR